MSIKHTRERKTQGVAMMVRQGANGRTATARTGWSSHRPLIIGLILGALGLGGAALWSALRSGATDQTSATDAAASIMTDLPPAPPGARVPLNDTDPFTGKPITPNSPTVTHKGYVIAFCCTECPAYKVGWARMSDSDRDAVVRRCLK